MIHLPTGANADFLLLDFGIGRVRQIHAVIIATLLSDREFSQFPIRSSPPAKPWMAFKGITQLFLVLLAVLAAIINPIPTGQPSEISPFDFVKLVENNRLVVSSGHPLERVTDDKTGQEYLRGIYGTGGRYQSTYSFQVLTSTNANDEVLEAVRRAGLVVINASDTMRPSTRWAVMRVAAVIVGLAYALTLFLIFRKRPAV